MPEIRGARVGMCRSHGSMRRRGACASSLESGISRLHLRSMMVLSLLFGLLFAIGMAAIYYADLDLSVAIVFAVGVILLQYAIGPYIIQWIYKIEWTAPEAFRGCSGARISAFCWRSGVSW